MQPIWIELRHPKTNKLIALFDPVRLLLRHVDKGAEVIISLPDVIEDWKENLKP